MVEWASFIRCVEIYSVDLEGGEGREWLLCAFGSNLIDVVNTKTKLTK